MEHFALWLSAFLTLGILSFLYKDNPWYKLSEAIFVGISAGFWLVTLFWDNLVGKFWDGWQDEPMLFIGAALGFLPIGDEQYDFVGPKTRQQRPAVKAFRELLADPQVRAHLAGFGLRLGDGCQGSP